MAASRTGYSASTRVTISGRSKYAGSLTGYTPMAEDTRAGAAQVASIFIGSATSLPRVAVMASRLSGRPLARA